MAVCLAGEQEIEEMYDLDGLVTLAKEVEKGEAMETEQQQGDNVDPEEEEDDADVTPVSLRKAQQASKDMQTFVFDNLAQFANQEEVQAAVHMLANSLNHLVVSSTMTQTGILQFFPVLPRRIEWRQEEEQNDEDAHAV